MALLYEFYCTQLWFNRSWCSLSFTFNSVLRGKLLTVVFEVQHNFSSLLNAAGFSDLKQSRAERGSENVHLKFNSFTNKNRINVVSVLSPIGGPLVSGSVRLRRAGEDVHTVSHHEGGVEADTKLTDDGAAGLCLVLQGI